MASAHLEGTLAGVTPARRVGDFTLGARQAAVLPCRITFSSGAGPDAAHDTSGTGEDGGHEGILHLPSWRAMLRHALPSLIESTIGPGLLFYVVLLTSGFRGAVIAALVWSVLAALRRVVRRERLPAILVLSLGLLVMRTVVAYATGSAFLYFIQPTASTFLVAALFLVSVVFRRPLAERFAHDFCPLDPDVLVRPFVRRFFLRVSLLWGVVLATQAGFVLWLLFVSSLRAFVVERQVVSGVLTAIGVAVSVVWFIRVMRRAGVSVRFTRASVRPVVSHPSA